METATPAVGVTSNATAAADAVKHGAFLPEPQLHLVLLRGPPQCQRRLSLVLPQSTSGSPTGLTIGRDIDCDVVLDPWLLFASSRHALLEQREDRSFWVTDLGSTNGTFVNKQRVLPGAAHAHELHHGDVVIFGGMRDVEGELDRDAMSRPELVMWRVETPEAAVEERRLFADLDSEATPTRGEGAGPRISPIPEALGADLYEPTALPMMPTEPEIDRYAHYLLRSAMQLAKGKPSSAPGSDGVTEDEVDEVEDDGAPFVAEATCSPERETSASPSRAPRSTLALSQAAPTLPKDPFLEDVTPSPASRPATHLSPPASHSRCDERPARNLEEEYEPKAHGVLGPITALPQLFPPTSVPAAAEETTAVAKKRGISRAAVQTSVPVPPPMQFSFMRLGQWRCRVPETAQPTQLFAPPAADGAKASGRARQRSPPSLVAGRPTLYQLSFTPTHWLWSVPRPNSGSAALPVRCILPMSSIATFLVCPSLCGLAVEIAAHVTQLPCPVPPDVLQGDSTNRWMVWVYAGPPNPSSSDSVKPEKGTQEAETSLALQNTLDPVEGADTTSLAFGEWIYAVFRFFEPFGLPEPHCVDEETFGFILSESEGDRLQSRE